MDIFWKENLWQKCLHLQRICHFIHHQFEAGVISYFRNKDDTTSNHSTQKSIAFTSNICSLYAAKQKFHFSFITSFQCLLKCSIAWLMYTTTAQNTKITSITGFNSRVCFQSTLVFEIRNDSRNRTLLARFSATAGKLGGTKVLIARPHLSLICRRTAAKSMIGH